MDKLRAPLQALVEAHDRKGESVPTAFEWRKLFNDARAALAEPVADEPVADDLPSREALADECSELRIILSKVTQALGTGAFASSACSLHFLRMIPEEVKKTVDGLRATRPAAAPAEPTGAEWVDKNVTGNPSLMQAMRNHAVAPAERGGGITVNYR